MRLRWSGLRIDLLRIWEIFCDHVFAAYWWGVIGLLAGLAWPLVVILPERSVRWRVVGVVARLFFRMSRTPLQVSGAENIPQGGGVLVANHSSYFDNVVLSAILRRPAVFVAKAELVRKFFARLFLEHVGALFVERAEVERSAEAAEQAIASARAGELLVFYPEGTLTRMPGLLPFRMGPFVTAAEAGVPIVAVALRGTRSILRGEQWFPRRGTVQVTFTPPITPTGRDWEAAVAARDAARSELLRLIGEPDLADVQVRF